MPKILLLLVILITFSIAATAQVFSNLDFEYGVYKGQPRKWAIEGEGQEYTARLEADQGRWGSKGLRVTLTNAQVFVFQSLPGETIAGKEVIVQGYYKSQSGDALQAMLAFHNPGGGRPNVSQPVSTNTGEWQVVSHRATFPNDYGSDRLLIALIAEGTGSFWFDEVTITIDGVPYGNGLPDFREPTRQEIKMLNARAFPITSFDGGAPSQDLRPLKGIVGSAAIVALGENSHGSSSIYKLKLRMIQYLVENEGFSVFALESPAVEADRINEYVLSGKGTIQQVVKDLAYPSWQTQEMIAIVQWLRTHNQTASKKVEFRGFDMQHGGAALKAVAEFASGNDLQLAKDLLVVDTLYNLRAKDDQQWRVLIQKTEQLVSYLGGRTYDGVDPVVSRQVHHYMEIFLQSLLSDKVKSRDEYMATNIDWIMKNSGDGTRIIVSADNTHITKATGKMGSYLEQWYDDRYLTIGFTYGQGTYAAYGSEKSYEVHPAFPGAYEYFFSKCQYDNFFLDTRKTSDMPILTQPAGFRSIGSRPQETTQFVDINLKDHFDVVVYLENSVHTEPILKQDH